MAKDASSISPVERQAFTIKEFCSAYRISRSKLYQLWAEGRGPERYKIDKSVRIPVDAARRWHEALRSPIASPRQSPNSMPPVLPSTETDGEKPTSQNR